MKTESSKPIRAPECLVKQCAQAIDDLDRETPRPLTSEDQARAVLECLERWENKDGQ